MITKHLKDRGQKAMLGTMFSVRNEYIVVVTF